MQALEPDNNYRLRDSDLWKRIANICKLTIILAEEEEAMDEINEMPNAVPSLKHLATVPFNIEPPGKEKNAQMTETNEIANVVPILKHWDTVPFNTESLGEEEYAEYYLNEKGERVYTLNKIDPNGRPTSSAHPARFSPDDKYSRQRGAIKKRFGLLLTQQPRPVM